MDKTQRLKDFLGICLKEDVNDLRGIPVKESTVNLGFSILMLLVTALHLALSCWQFAVSLLLVGYDLIAKVLTKVMPAPKEITKEKA
jgi:hypothetical protein